MATILQSKLISANTRLIMSLYKIMHALFEMALLGIRFIIQEHGKVILPPTLMPHKL
ncbi:hypothetical protein KKC_02539 [Listeria fleischmannii subsp. coloradonensis]|nr:hypothetical protein KKC_02539 [Listeria fleischmannii subsp. coloradonensis]